MTWLSIKRKHQEVPLQQPQIPESPIIEIPSSKLPSIGDWTPEFKELNYLHQLRNYYFWELNSTTVRFLKNEATKEDLSALSAKLSLLTQLIGKNI